MRSLALACLLGSAAPAIVGPSLLRTPRPRCIIRAAADGGAGPTSPTTRAQPPRATATGDPGSFFYHLLVEPFLTPLLRAFEPLDRGDFRWEFLVPWTNKTLSTVDKFIVCSTFIGLSFTLQTLADPGASVGVHLSYIAQFFSYAMGDPIGFRLLAVLTAVLEIGGNLFETKEAGLIVSGGTMSLLDALANVNIEDVFPIFYDCLLYTSPSPRDRG